MSRTIWGTPLCGMPFMDSDQGYTRITNLNDWTPLDLPGIEIDYNECTTENKFSFMMESRLFERFVYILDVVPNTNYRFSAKIHGAFEAAYGPLFLIACSEELDAQVEFGNQSYKALGEAIIQPNSKKEHYSAEFNSGSCTQVYLYIDLCGSENGKEASFEISNIQCGRVPEGPISYACKPFNLNILNGDIWNFIAVEPGAWFYSVYDDHKTHHMYFLAGNEFKLLEFQDADGNGVIPHKEYHSSPITIKGKRYHSLYLSRTVDSVCPFPTAYYELSELPSDEKIYTELTDYVLNYAPYDRGDVLGLLALRNLLSANSGDVNVDLDDLKALLKGYTVEERQNPYLDDPNLDDAGYPTVSFHD